MTGLDAFLERDQDRALFDLPPRPKDGLTASQYGLSIGDFGMS